MSVEPLVYKDTIQNILTVVEGKLSPRIVERLQREALIDVNALAASYPLKAHDAMVKVLSEELYPTKSIDEATYELGMSMMGRYGDSLLGKALFAVIRMLGPMKVLKRVPEYFKQGNNYADVKIEVTGPSSYILDHNEVGAWPHYVRGSMHGSGKVIGLKGHAVELLSYDGHRATLRVSWDE